MYFIFISHPYNEHPASCAPFGGGDSGSGECADIDERNGEKKNQVGIRTICTKTPQQHSFSISLITLSHTQLPPSHLSSLSRSSSSLLFSSPVPSLPFLSFSSVS